MADLFKNLFSEELISHTAQALQEVNCTFEKAQFQKQIFDIHWEEKEFKERMHHIADVVRSNLSDDFKDVVQELYIMIAYFKSSGADKVKFSELAFVFIPDIIEKFGINDFNISVEAFEKITPFTTCEFAVRPFIIKYQDKMLNKVQEWTKHENEHVRRLASEGSRPRLPWGMALAPLKQNPKPIMSILEALKNDSSEYVRKSVANNLNDISKDNPETVIEIAKAWIGKTKETDWIVKHACRTLLKAGNSEVLQLFGFAPPHKIELNDLTLKNESIKTGDELEFSFLLTNVSSKSEKVRLEYAIYYMKKNGSQSKKVYKISEKDYAAKSVTKITRKQSFKKVSTRKFYAGEHILSVIINGKEIEERTFELIEVV
ncbi:DNA alkylation repair protein [Saccharicrinis aurantiacus]|uniref:DNA alkylation repair protein n=1 Tax=Saccharicrinis aurantiacus TaxID=1849719 RepID=UPI002492EAA7|nr:DNA alkylation repair protein [Saccharicrinis aurantiacus]